jgi:glycosyltransferase involved in cell wall biosynthesis
MKFCMITTFFGAHSFGGDAAFVDRLCRILIRDGHEVHVIHSMDAFYAVHGKHPLKTYQPPEGLKVHALHHWFGFLDTLWTHQTGRMGRKRKTIQSIFHKENFDVFHFHNISLIGAPDIFTLTREYHKAVKLMTASEHWLRCPLSLLWKFNCRVCERPSCMSCMLMARRPPQWWRYSAWMKRNLEQSLDALIFPSYHTMEVHLQMGLNLPSIRIPYFLPPDWGESGISLEEKNEEMDRPYFIMVGRMVKEKGFHMVIPLMERFPDCDLKIAGTGPSEDRLRTMASHLSNIHFLGLLDYPALQELFRRAVAVIVPSLFYETFGYVSLEAFSQGTPALVRNCGALPELIEQSGGGFVFKDPEELVSGMKKLITDADLRKELGMKGLKAARTIWSEEQHLKNYLKLIHQVQTKKP